MKFGTHRPSMEALCGVVLTAATYIYFLIFAQFAFLRLIEAAQIQGSAVRIVMAPMAVAGVLGSMLAARFLRGRVVRVALVASFGGCAAAAMLALMAKGTGSFMFVSAMVGGSLSVATVSLAVTLRQLLPSSNLGLLLGMGTGTAYAICNIPAVFAGSPFRQSVVAFGACVIALLLARGLPPLGEPPPANPAKMATAVPIGVLLGAFLALVWLDSASFFILQRTPTLNRFGWADPVLQWSNAGIHLAVAVAAGYLLDRGGAVFVILAAYVCLALAAFLCSAESSIAQLMHWFYASGVSLYSTALVFMPLQGIARGNDEAVARRAGVLYGIAGWGGSTLGIGMAQDLHRIPQWFIVAAGLVLVGEWIWYRNGISRLALNFGIAASAIALLGAAGSNRRMEIPQDVGRTVNFADQVSAGREVYISEGCMHCHSQYVRPNTRDVVWWGPAADPRQTLEQAPPLIGNRRQGPDLMNVGNRRSAAWNRIHLMDPRALVPESKMPSYAYLFRGEGRRGESLLAYLAALGAETIPQRMAVRSEWKLSENAAPFNPAQSTQLFENQCVACHGRTGAGDGKQAVNLGERQPRDLTRAQWQFIPRCENQPDRLQEIARVIKFGVPTTSMPGHETLSDAELLSLARYVESLQRSGHPL